MKTQYLALRKLTLAALVAAMPFQMNAQLSVSANKTASQLANAMVGTGVTISNATLTCPSGANGTFTGGANALDISSGIILTSGSATVAASSASTFSSEDNGAGGDANLSTLSGNATFDACVLEFDFVPLGDSIKFDYQFGSEEYPNFTCTQFNDVFGFFISGPGYSGPTNIALVPGTNIPVAINSVNGGTPTGAGVLSNCTGMGPGSPFPAYFINNQNGPAPVYDGLTMVFSAKAAVTPCETYHFKLGVADASDGILTSGVFIEEGSLTVLPPAIVGCPSNISVNTGAAATTCSAQASWTPPTADNSCLDVQVSSTHNPGDVFPVGTTTVTYSFTNIGGTSTCSFDVTVVDNTPPTAVCQNYTLNLVNGMGTVTPANVNNGSSDNCEIQSMSVSPNSFTCEDAGENVVTLTVTDIHGNSSTCNATVTVQYQPTCSIVSVPENNVYTGGNPNNIYLGYGPQTATLNATATGGSGFTYSWSPSTNLSCSNCEDPVFSPTAGGTYTFTLTATNSNGCSTTCDITFCVLDIRDPNHPNKVFMCHNAGNPQTISISVNAVPSHFLGHVGDLLGKCTDVQCGTAAKGSYTENGPAAVPTVSEIIVYPNPVTGIVTVELPAGVNAHEAVLMDIAGRKLQTKVFDGSSKLSFDMTKEAKGVYMIEVVNGTSVYRSRIVKD
ncbi:choice-of-anchor L domain-containing protein [Polluticoccus soli]|uniref:choice-of-anchor L domain-containing protein n=1 Tax=Polluticoccus soli TaxID=3034150 RepID=UPI0023E2466C|nr:choice-of-anchor L domain-containing protein [Flavipsychrobacter sp. JY13-12]